MLWEFADKQNLEPNDIRQRWLDALPKMASYFKITIGKEDCAGTNFCCPCP